MFGAREAAWPLIREDLGLSYVQVALVLAVPGYIAYIIEPIFGVLADRGLRRPLILAGGAVFAAATVAFGVAPGFALLLGASIASSPASGAFVGLSQTALMDGAPGQRVQNMARWTLAGSAGVVIGPLLLLGSVAAGGGWRPVFAGLGVAMAALLIAARRLPRRPEARDEDVRTTIRETVALMRRREVLRWLLLLELGNLMLDVFNAYLALYLVDVAHATPAQAAAGVAVWSGAGLAGDAALLVVLRHVSGLRWLRLSAVAALVVYPAFLLTSGLGPRLVLLAALGLLNSGWYAIPQARLYDAVGERSGAVLTVSTLSGMVGNSVPLIVGLAAGAAGLGPALWFLLLGPLGLVLGLPRTTRGQPSG